MAEILNKYKRWKARLILNRERELDFVLSQDNSPTVELNGELTEKCLISYIDMNIDGCVNEDGSVSSVSGYTYEKYVNNNVELPDFGFTAVDNGRVEYDKDSISLDEFVGILTGSTITLPDNDAKLHLYPVKGNSKYYEYPVEIMEDEWDKYYAFKGGFLQGFYKLFNFDYEVLPKNIENCWNLEFVIRPRTDYEVTGNTLNNEHPENNGIFFYMGTRSENKFGRFNGEDITKYPYRESFSGDCFDLCETKGEGHKTTKCDILWLRNFLFAQPTDSNTCNGECKECEDCSNIDTALTVCTVDIATSEGHKLDDNKYFEITTDNKYLIFDRTKNGYTVDTWDDDAIMVINQRKLVNKENLFLLMDRTKSGYTVDTIENYFNSLTGQSKDYSIMADVMDNAFALKVNEDGSVGYKYLIKDCDAPSGFTIKSEQTFSGMVKGDEWSTVNVMFKIMDGSLDRCGNSRGNRTMKIFIYVNGYLKLVSQELPEFRFRELNEYYDKQEGVPFSISLGGGTQGLAESMWVDNYTRPYCRILPIEENFGGSFIGDIRSFKFYDCQMQYNEVKNNYLFENRDTRPMFFFGYMPIKTFNGKVTDETISGLTQLTGDEIRAIPTINEIRSKDSVVELTGGGNMIIPSVIGPEELADLLRSGIKYNDIADDYNNAITLMIPLSRYESKHFDIIDETFNISMLNNFEKVNCVTVNGEKYVLLCLFNEQWAYSRIGKDKVFSPTKLVMSL